MLIWLTLIAIIFFVLLLVIIWKLNQNGIHDNTMFTILIALYFIGVFIVIVTVLLTLRSFVKPMRQITENALKIAEGNYDIELDCEIYDIDWHLLIQMFNQMSEEIHRKIDQFNTQNELLITKKNEIEELNERLKVKVELKSKKLNEYINIIDKYIITSQTDIHGVITYASDAFCRISGYTKEELIGKNHRIIRHPDMPAELFTELWATISSGKIWHGEIKNKKADGSYYWVDTTISPNSENGKIIGYTAVRHDITNQKRVEQLAITDSMTGLYNRRHYAAIIQEEMNRARRHDFSMALMMLDVDYFKCYNDTYGHQAGDAVLNQVADILKVYTSRSGEYAFRLGGEEFGVLVSEMSQEEYLNLGNLIRREIEALAITHKKNNASPYVTISMGIALYHPDSTLTYEELYKAADNQLYMAKDKGRNQVMMKSF